MTTIERTEQETVEQEVRTAHALALIVALAPDPSAWEYRGQCNDTGPNSNAKCACGHPIRYEFPIYRGVESRVVGSTCVEHFAALNPETGALMLAKLEELQSKLAEQKKAAKAAIQQAEVDTLKSQFEAAYSAVKARFDGYRERGVYAPYELWSRICGRGRVPSHAPEYQRACDYIRWYKQQTARLQATAAV